MNDGTCIMISSFQFCYIIRWLLTEQQIYICYPDVTLTVVLGHSLSNWIDMLVVCINNANINILSPL